jgi:hypothetical protein
MLGRHPANWEMRRVSVWMSDAAVLKRRNRRAAGKDEDYGAPKEERRMG